MLKFDSLEKTFKNHELKMADDLCPDFLTLPQFFGQKKAWYRKQNQMQLVHNFLDHIMDNLVYIVKHNPNLKSVNNYFLDNRVYTRDHLINLMKPYMANRYVAYNDEDDRLPDFNHSTDIVHKLQQKTHYDRVSNSLVSDVNKWFQYDEAGFAIKPITIEKVNSIMWFIKDDLGE